MAKKYSTWLLVLLVFAACSRDAEQVAGQAQEPYDPTRDYFTFANYDAFTTRHLSLDLTVDFESEQLTGSVTLFLTRLDTSARTVILDIRDIEVQKAGVYMPAGMLAEDSSSENREFAL